MASKARSEPNILITGTPGVGKSTLCQKLSEETSLECIDVGKFAKDNDCLESFDEEYQCAVLDEDKVIDRLKDIMKSGGKIVEYHGCDFFPKRWFDVVFVLRTNNTVLYDRLALRNYSAKKMEKNIECEILQTLLEEAKDWFDPKIVHEVQNNTPEEMEKNISDIKNWIQAWKSK